MKIFIFYKDHLTLIKDDQCFGVVFDQIVTSFVACQARAALDKEKEFSTLIFSHSQNLQDLLIIFFLLWSLSFIFFRINVFLSHFINFLWNFLQFHIRIECAYRLLHDSGKIFRMNTLLLWFWWNWIRIAFGILKDVLLFELFLWLFCFILIRTLFQFPSIWSFSLLCFQRLLFRIFIAFRDSLLLLWLIFLLVFLIKVNDHLFHIDEISRRLPGRIW